MGNHPYQEQEDPNELSSSPAFRILSGSTAKDKFTRMVYDYIRDEGTIGITIKELASKYDLNYHTIRDHVKRLEQITLIRKRNVGVYRDAKYVVVALEGDKSIPYVPDFLFGKELMPLNKYWNVALNLMEGQIDPNNFPANPYYKVIQAICHLVWAGECASEAIGEEMRENPALARNWRIRARSTQQDAFDILYSTRDRLTYLMNAINILLDDDSLHTEKMRQLYNMFIDVPTEYQVKRNHDTEHMVFDWEAINKFFENYMRYEMEAVKPATSEELEFQVAKFEPSANPDPTQIRTEIVEPPTTSPIQFDPNL